MTLRILMAAAAGLALTTGAFAQSYTAPAGVPAAAAPGGPGGWAAGPNFAGAYYRGAVRPVDPGTVTVEGIYTGSAAGRARYGR